MAMKWWGTVNLPAVVAARCMIHAITGLARADSRLMVRLLTWRIGRRGGVGWGGICCMDEDETLVYIPPWAVLLHRPETLGAYPKKSAVILCSTRRRRPWVLACTRPKTCNQHGIFTKMEAIGMMLKAAESWDGSMAGAGHF